MCRLLFLASDRVLPEIPWNPDQPSFHVRRTEIAEKVVEAHLTKPYLYYVGSSEMCGCGFAAPEAPIEDEFDQMEHGSAAENLAELVKYLAENLTPFETLELYQAWDGALSRRPSRTVAVGLSQIDDATFGQDEPLLFRITRRSV
jgi:hypothetical protein